MYVLWPALFCFYPVSAMHVCMLQDFQTADPADSYKEKITETPGYQSYYSLVPLHTPHHQVHSCSPNAVVCSCGLTPSRLPTCHRWLALCELRVKQSFQLSFGVAMAMRRYSTGVSKSYTAQSIVLTTTHSVHIHLVYVNTMWCVCVCVCVCTCVRVYLCLSVNPWHNMVAWV